MFNYTDKFIWIYNYMTTSECKEQKYKKTLDDVLMQCSWADILECSVYFFFIHI